MEAPPLERKLVAILAADVEGFSRHMERDEARTLAVLSQHRRIIDDAILEHKGRITSTAGDSVLAEFGSVLSAVNCAVLIQRLLAGKNADLAEEERLYVRVGINVGDVMIKDGDIFGDGVNIAARLESLAEPGGICVSRGVRDHLRKHRLVVFEDLGEQKVKNIAQPVRAFKVQLGEIPLEPHADNAREVVAESDPALPSEVELAFWNTVKETGTVAELDAYLERYPDGAFAVVARTQREALLSAHATRSRPQSDVVAVELAFWESAKDSGNPAELQAYLESYPEGEFVELAKARLETLQVTPPAKEEVSEAELTFWNSIKDRGNPDMFRAYLKKYPNGTYAELARINSEGRTAQVPTAEGRRNF